MVDVSYWRQKDSVTAHLVNLTNPMAMKGYMREILPMGPYSVSLELPAGRAVKAVRLLAAGVPATTRQDGARLMIEVPRLEVHEVIAVDLA